MRAALDTNILVYAEGLNGEARQTAARDLLLGIVVETIVPAQVLGEVFRVLTRKARRTAGAARAAVLDWRDAYLVQDTTAAVLASAMDLAADHAFDIWDAVIVAAAAEAGCRVLLSEDMHDGFTWRGLTVVDPFREANAPLLNLLRG